MPRTTTRTLRSLRPSPAMVVATAALFVALGGAGYAATTIGSEEIRNNSIENVDVKNDDLLSRDIKDGTILRRDVSPTALDSLEGPRAFARVVGTASPVEIGLVDDGNAKGIDEADVSNPSDGVYCFTNLGFDPKVAIATREPTVPDTVTVVSALAFNGSICGSDEQASVQLVRRDTGAPVDGRFYVMFE